MTPTRSQPYVELIGPPIDIPNPNRVRHPDRIEMMVNETAKFENAPIPRRSSCAYPSSWSRWRSCDEPEPGDDPLEPASPIATPFPRIGGATVAACIRVARCDPVKPLSARVV